MYGHTPSLRDAHPIVPCEVHAVIGTRKSRIGGSERQSALGAWHQLGTIGARQSIQPSKIKGPDHRLSDPATEIDARTLEDSPGVFGRRLGVDTGNVRSLFFVWRSPSGPQDRKSVV